jgi:uncharacterized protein (TIGR02600 family)
MKSQDSRKCAVALVLVLGFLVIISALAVAFFASVTTELRASRNFQSNVNTRQLQDSVVNIVEGQIRQATSVIAGNVSSQNVSWASQPGMITTFGSAGQGSSNLLACYKLYSSNVMTVAGSGTNTSLPPVGIAGDYSTTYDQNPAIWTDLNSPVWVQDPSNPNVPSQVLPRFPIIDPRANYYTGTTTAGSTSASLVEGFDFTQSAYAGSFQNWQVYADTGQSSSVTDATSFGNDARLAMPVRWMYVLKDGTLTAPVSIGSGTNGAIQASWQSPLALNPPTSSNPIVGRVAFWTDDDTSKVNINTAGGGVWTSLAMDNQYSAQQWAGSYWDTPRVTSQFDEGQVYGPPMPAATYQSSLGGTPVTGLGGLATTQMLQNEFQRYPGHPAQTSLALIFNSIMTTEQLYMLTPRITYNGFSNGSTGGSANTSVEGTNRLHLAPSQAIAGAATTGVTANQALPIRYDRLYDSVDELIFAYNTVSGDTNPPSVRRTNINYLQMGSTPTYSTTNINSPAQFTPGLLDRLRFFLTAYNRAPELNLFGFPRVCVWPIRSQRWADDTNQLTTGINAYDSLSLFCSTIGPAVYSYPGLNSDSPTPNAFGTTVLGQVTEPPFRYSFFRHEPTSTTVTSASADINLPRNQDLLKYLQQMTSQADGIPGFGGSFQAKYGTANMDETLVEMFDYIRCANLYDTTVTNTTPNPQSLNPSPAANPHPFSPTGIVMPSVATFGGGNQLGMGRFPTIAEATLVFYYAGSDVTYANTAAQVLLADSVNATTLLYPPRAAGPAIVSGTTAPAAQRSENSGVLVISPPDMPTANANKPLTQVPKTRYMRAALIFSTFNPMQGYGPIQNPAPNFPLSGDVNPMVTFQITGLNTFKVTSASTGATTGATNLFPSTPAVASISLGATSGYFWGGRNFGGFEGFVHTLANCSGYIGTTPTLTATAYQNSGLMTLSGVANSIGIPVGPITAQVPNAYNCDFEETTPPTFAFSGGICTVTVLFGGSPIQSIGLNFPAATAWPAPRGDDIIDAEPFSVTAANAEPASPVNSQPILANAVARQDNTGPTVSVNGYSFNTGNPQSYGQLRRWYWSQDFGSFDPNQGRITPARISGSSQAATFSNVTSPWNRTVAWARDFQSRINWVINTAQGSDSDNPVATSSASPGSILGWGGGRWRQIVQPGDTVRSLIFCNLPSTLTTAGPTMSGDLRLAAVTNTIPTVSTGATGTTAGYYPHPDYTSTFFHQACLLRMADAELYYNYAGDQFFNAAANTTTGFGPSGYTIGAQNTTWYSNQSPFGNHVQLGGTSVNGLTGKVFPPYAAVGNLPRKLTAGTIASPLIVNGVITQSSRPGDFDTGVGAYPDGPYFNKQDEGNAIFVYLNAATGVVTYPIPYFGNGSYAAPGSAFDSPNRQMPSPVMMGSLLSQAAPLGGVMGPHGWETLCFCPNPAAGAGSLHNGNVAPKDHLLLDLFQMPAVQPYPISEPFSTAGKVNLNYQIQPFDYITRSTALRAALATERVMVLGSATGVNVSPGPITNQAGVSGTSADLYWCYKQQSTNGTTGFTNLISSTLRNVIDRDQTVNEIGYYIAANGVFRSPSQICEIYLVPQGWNNIAATPATINTSQTAFATAANAAQTMWTTTGDLTGDNLREKPYADIYPRLTTKSNTYTIHMKVQALRQQPHPANSTLYQIWDESKDAVLGEYRGSATIERYIDPADRHFNPSDSLTQTNNDFVNPDNTLPSNSLESLYRFRTTNTKKFSP